MATFQPVSPQQTTTRNANFIPEIWSDEIIAAYETNLVLAPLIRKMSMVGKKGDTIHVPKPNRGEANAKVAETAVTLNSDTAGELQIIVDQHFEYSQMFEDIAELQSLSSARRFYTEDAGYALAKNVDDALFNLGVYLGSGSRGTGPTGSLDPTIKATWADTAASFMVDGSGELVDYDGTSGLNDITDAAFRAGLQKLDDNDVPMTNRFLIICPSQVNTMRGIDRYVSSDFVSGRPVVNGKIGELYGVPIYITTNVPNVSGDRMNLLGHQDAYVMSEQQGVRSQTQYKQEFLSTLFTADRLYGLREYREDNAINIVTG